MENYFVLSFDRGDFELTEFEAEDRDKADEIFEEEMLTNFGKDILLDEDDFEKFKKKVLDFMTRVEVKDYQERAEQKQELSDAQIEDLALEQAREIDFEKREMRADLIRKYENPITD